VESAVASSNDVVWHGSMLDALLIPGDKKRTVVSLAKARTGRGDTTSIDDIIPGKGRGLNVLLHIGLILILADHIVADSGDSGPLGVGKTLIVEARQLVLFHLFSFQ